jgi:hypothetical protein
MGLVMRKYELHYRGGKNVADFQFPDVICVQKSWLQQGHLSSTFPIRVIPSQLLFSETFCRFASPNGTS